MSSREDEGYKARRKRERWWEECLRSDDKEVGRTHVGWKIRTRRFEGEERGGGGEVIDMKGKSRLGEERCVRSERARLAEVRCSWMLPRRCPPVMRIADGREPGDWNGASRAKRAVTEKGNV